jgi:hypothetical protein
MKDTTGGLLIKNLNKIELINRKRDSLESLFLFIDI